MINIVTYGPSEDAPAAMRYAAAMVPTKEPGSHWIATGATAEAARAKLEAMWAKEHPVRTGPPKKAAPAPEPAPEVDDLDLVL